MSVPETVPNPIVSRTGDVLGYARVSTADQDAASQHDRLEEAGAICIFTDIVSGAAGERPELARLIGEARPGDSLCVTRLDRLGRSLAELLATVGDLRSRGIHLVLSCRVFRGGAWDSLRIGPSSGLSGTGTFRNGRFAFPGSLSSAGPCRRLVWIPGIRH